MEQDKNFSLFSTLKNKALIPKSLKVVSLRKIKDEILGKKYELSIVLIGRTRSKSLNNKYGKKNKSTDILSFPISSLSGEIFIAPEIAKMKAKKFNMTFQEYLLFLVIHGSLHLKGLKHGVKMKAYEFTYYSRYRRRYL